MIILLWVLGFFFLFFLFFVPLFLSIFSLLFTRNRGISPDLEESAAALGGSHGLLSHPPLIANATPHLTVSASFVALLLRFLTIMAGSLITCLISSQRFDFCMKFLAFEVDLFLGLLYFCLYGLGFGGILALSAVVVMALTNLMV